MSNPRSVPISMLRGTFLVLLGLNGLVELIAAAVMFFDFQRAMKMFGIDYSPGLDILGLVMGNALLFVACIAVVGVAWTLRGKTEGVIAGIAVGLFLLNYGLLASLLHGDANAIAVDGVRGLTQVVVGVVLLRRARLAA